MNTVRIILGEYFQSPMGTMNFPAYFNYVNTAGKITARSSMDILIVICTALEEQEKINAQNEEDKKQIFEILAKLVKAEVPEKVEESISEPSGSIQEQKFEGLEQLPADSWKTSIHPDGTAAPAPFICPICKKGLSTKLALAGHSRSHK